MNKLISILLLCTLCACSSTTIFRTGTPGAKIFVNDRYYGTESAVYSDRKISFLKSTIKIEKEGCNTATYIMSKNDRLDYMALLGGVILIFPILWLMRYEPIQQLNYTCTN